MVRVRVRARVRSGVPLPSSELSSRIMAQKEASSASGSLLTVVSYLVRVRSRVRD